MSKFYNKCPNYKSNEGFKVMIFLKGYQEESYSFKGNIITCERHPADDIEKYAECLNCGASIETDKLKMK
jgi:hypothetical protein